MTTPLVLSQDDIEAGGNKHEFSNHGIEGDFTYNNNVHSANMSIRLGFLKKVYGLLSIQLLITVGVGAIFMFSGDPVKEYVFENSWVVFTTCIVTFIILIALHFKRREHPTNLILLTAFTLSESLLIGIVVSLFDALMVIEAFFITFFVVLSLTLYTFQSKKDFSSMGAGLYAGLCVLIVGGFIQIFAQNTILEMTICIAGAMIFSLYIIYDTHMLMHKHSPEEYVLVTVELYLDIINLFLYILRILAAAKK
ncbi:protein lifeguard 4-like [Leptopilina heterotoma]|uniref:protein lifeguard 4-like n=1 Tax=Leptopilina heterotoma TaxID=63436 RepID=UPI001CA9ACFD|nr:protein lifeguard 4-like [Leptopilina heterotoma]XP_043463467.1 protein lifeguard 4-like [Leptopilina heterotoma]XP_043463468.1 protein lifeguard 4-like [Leptopilina heterotoma]XP_043463469.1 protein lifeguard 4-like [Leptopilina heterotoma]